MKRFIAVLLLSLPSACRSVPGPEDCLTRGNLLLDAGDPASAIDAYTDCLDQDPRCARAYNNRGLARAARRDLQGALSDYDSCIALPEPFAEAYYNRAVACYRLGRNGDAVADFTEALKLNPRYPKARAGRGLAFAAGGDRPSALADFQKALELAPPDWPERKSIEAEIARLSK